MIKVGVPPQVADFATGALQTINQWFKAATDRFNLQTKSGLPVIGEVPNNQWALYKDTATGNVYLVVNDNGTIKKVQLV